MEDLITLNKNHRKLKKFSEGGMQVLEKQTSEYADLLIEESIKYSEYKSRSKIIEVIASHVCTAAAHIKDTSSAHDKWYVWILEAACALLPLIIGLLYNEQKMAVNGLRFWTFFALTITYTAMLVFKFALKINKQ